MFKTKKLNIFNIKLRKIYPIFFFVVTPTGIIMKLLGKDLIKLKKNNENSYWIEKKDIKSSMKNQF